MDNKARILHFLQYLSENTDENRAVTHGDILAHYAAMGEKVSVPTMEILKNG